MVQPTPKPKAPTLGSVIHLLEQKTGRRVTQPEIMEIVNQLGLIRPFTEYLEQKGELEDPLLDPIDASDKTPIHPSHHRLASREL